jgi:hypothetical protein
MQPAGIRDVKDCGFSPLVVISSYHEFNPSPPAYTLDKLSVY